MGSLKLAKGTKKFEGEGNIDHRMMRRWGICMNKERIRTNDVCGCTTKERIETDDVCLGMCNRSGNRYMIMS